MEHLSVELHPLLDLRAFITDFPRTLSEMSSPAELPQLLSLDADAPLQSSDEVRLAVRDLCLFDPDGPCGNAVKDSQRTKTGPETRRTLTLIWGTTALPNRAAATEAWYHSLLKACDAVVRPVWP